jgi:beta-glucuronidase
MPRRYRDHELRRVDTLDGLWDFAFLGDVDLDAIQTAALVFNDVMAVPGCFDATPKYAGRRGVAAYRLRVPLGKASRYLLELDGVHHRSVLFCDGQRIGEHSGGYTRFFHELPSGLNESAKLVLLVDNRILETPSSLHREFYDFYHFGGISRTIRLHHLSPTYIERVELSTLSLEPPTVSLRCYVHSQVSAPSERLRVWVDKTLLLDETMDLVAGSGCIEQELTLPKSLPWSPELPQLQYLKVQLGNDDLVVRFGLRTVSTASRQLLLNGNPVVLRGVNRHESHPLFGCATADTLKVSDLQLLKELGCNFLRGSHYPQDDTLLDLCDEFGLMVFEEGIGWQNKVDQLTNQAFIAAQQAHVDEMLDMSFNHPSVILWGILNEGESQELASRPAYAELLGHIKARDPYRLVTYASNRPYSDACLDLADVISVNTYPGWYSGTLDTIETELDAVLTDYRTRGGERPILVSEVGASSIYGCHDCAEQRWTEEYQTQLLERVVTHLLAPNTDCVGVCLWQFADARTSDSLSTIFGKPRGYNNKGIVDEYRRKKAAFANVKRLFLADKRSRNYFP